LLLVQNISIHLKHKQPAIVKSVCRMNVPTWPFDNANRVCFCNVDKAQCVYCHFEIWWLI